MDNSDGIIIASSIFLVLGEYSVDGCDTITCKDVLICHLDRHLVRNALLMKINLLNKLLR